MNCPNCQHDNEADAAFCEVCGSKLELACAHCGRALKPAAKFCPGCGNPVTVIPEYPEPTPREVVDYTPKHLADKILQSRSALEGERKQVTVLFADIKGSMDLARQLDAEQWHDILDRFFAILNDGVHRFEGTVNQYTGDGIMALFGAPIAHEDHAQRACYAALQLRDEVRRFAVELRVHRGIDFNTRIGINSGEVVVGKIGDDLRMDYTAQGHTVGVAQRLESIAEPGRVYMSEHTAHLVEGFFQLIDLGVTQLAGVENPSRIFDLDSTTGARTRFDVSRARGLTRFIGRQNEMDALGAALERARSGFGQAVGVVGEPGLGKSRLCFEFVERCRAQAIPVYSAHCPAHGKAIPFIPILELLRKFFDITAQDSPAQARQKIAGALILLDPAMHAILPVLFEFLGVADPHTPAERIDAEARQRQLFELVHKLTQAQNERGLASVIFIDDLHWIDTWSDDFVARLVEATQASHTLLLVNFRPEHQPSWTVKPHYQQLPLVPLGEDAVRDMAASLLGDDDSVSSLIEKIVQVTDGNPLFAEEIINTLVETSQLGGARGAYRLDHDVEALDFPPTILTIIAARIDRLDDTCKRILHSASVVGKKFTRPLIERMAKVAMPELIAAIEQLKALDFIYEISLYPTIEYSFKQTLVHEVAYDTQLKEHRAAGHASAAEAIEVFEADNLDEFASTLAYHWDAANEPARAIKWHQRAGEYTLMNDPAASLRHWQRVRGLMDELPAVPEMLSLGALACTRILDIGWQLGFGEDEATRCFDDGKSLAERAGDVALLARLTGAFASLRGINLGYAAEYVNHAREAVQLAQRTDNVILQRAMQMRLAHGFFLSGRHAEGHDLSEHELHQMPQTGVGPRPVFLMIRGLTLSMTNRDPDLAHRCLQESQDLAAADGRAELAIAIHGNWTQLLCLQGDYVAANEHASAATQLCEGLGTGLSRSWAVFARARVSLAEGGHEEAVGSFDEALRIAQESRTSGFLIASALAGLAEACCAGGDRKQAQQYATEAVEFARSHALGWDITPWLALARTGTHDGESTGARQAIEEAQQMIERTGAVIFQPFLHECRAAFAASFDCEWSSADELHEAQRLFMEFGAAGHQQRIAALL